jgi:hypothetical protein
MKIQRHVRQDFQPVYIKLETLEEVKALNEALGWQVVEGDPENLEDALNIKERICKELDTIIEAGGILP